VLKRHIDAIYDVTGSYRHVAIGSDLDGFIKPTLAGLQSVDDLGQLPERLERLYPGHAREIMHGNALRILEAAFEGRPRSPSGEGAGRS
jgi:microsomal dipeptidase-like Zn-dependent dipeptidase